MKVALVHPPLVGYAGDPFSHVPAMPLGLLHVAAATRAAGHEVRVLDAFALAPGQRTRWMGELEFDGLGPDGLAVRVDPDTDLVGVSAHSGGAHRYVLTFVRAVKERLGVPVVVGGPFASTRPEAFLDGGADFVVVGEGDEAFPALLASLERNGRAAPSSALPAVAFPGGVRPAPAIVEDLDALPLPAFDLLDREPYYRIARSHGPFRGPYLPLSTSRGCPCACAFCATPFLSGRRWRGRSADKVVADIEELARRYGVSDFHIEDDNFTTSPARALAVAEGVRALGEGIGWSLPSAVRVNDVTEELLEAMHGAGLHYIAFSPESGSSRVRELMGKDVDVERLLGLVRRAVGLGVATQACFVAGFPGETEADRALTLDLLRRLAAAGVDDVSVFILAPVPGSAIAGSLGPAPCFEGLNWTPRWRPGFAALERFRRRCYLELFAIRALRHPRRLAASLARTVTGRYRTKGEMVAGSMLREKVAGR